MFFISTGKGFCCPLSGVSACLKQKKRLFVVDQYSLKMWTQQLLHVKQDLAWPGLWCWISRAAEIVMKNQYPEQSLTALCSLSPSAFVLLLLEVVFCKWHAKWRNAGNSHGNSLSAGQDCRFAPRGGVLLSAMIFLCPKLLLEGALTDSPVSAGMCCSLLLFKQRLCHPRWAWVTGWIKWTILYSISGWNEQFQTLKMCAQYFALLKTVSVPGCEQAELSCAFLISLQENESGLCCWTCTASFLSPRAWGTLNICTDMCSEMGLFLCHLKWSCSQLFSQAGDPGQAEHLCSQMLGVSIYKASRNPVVFINDLRCTESLQMAGYS